MNRNCIFAVIMLLASPPLVGCSTDAAPAVSLFDDVGVGPDAGAGGGTSDSGLPTDDAGPSGADGGMPDASGDAGLPAPTPPPNSVAITGGGGTRRSPRFEMTLSVGGPAPVANTQNERHGVKLGVTMPQGD